jgi:hypothetical protein
VSSKVYAWKHLSGAFPVHNGPPKQGDAFLSVLFNFSVEYAERMRMG